MRKILLLSVSLLLLGVVGAKATITNWSPSDAWGTTWTAGTNTLSWNKGWFNGLYTGFAPKVQNNAEEVDLSMYTKIRYTITSLSGTASDVNGAYIDLKVRSTGKDNQTIKLREGVHDIVFAEYASTIDFSKILELTISATYADGSNDGDPGSAVITEMYLYNPVKTTYVATGFGDEITSLSGITDGTKFVISDNGTKAKYFYTNNENENANVENIPSDAYFYFTLEEYTGDAVSGDNVYKIKVTNAAGEGYPRGTSGGYYLNAVLNFSNVVISGPEAGWSNAGNEIKDALWYVTYDAENGFSFQNVYRIEHSVSSWLSLEKDFNSSQQYLKLYKSIVFEESTDLEKVDNPSNDALFALSDASGYNAETGVMTNGTWTFETPVDISDWDYLMITTINNPSDASHEITITDDNGVSVHGEDYKGSEAGTGGNMWLDRWNNQNAIRISLDYLRINKSMDITKIKTLRIGGTTKIANVYLTDYNNTKISGGYKDGDIKREYVASTVGKFGTICLPYVASYSGAEIYSISGKSVGSISLAKVTGLLEAGKPYFYVAADANGKNNSADDTDVHNVNFFRADLSKFDAASAGTNNGLIGTFSGISPLEPNDDYYVLSNNTLYQVDAGAVDEKAVSIGANKAYVDISQIVNLGGAVKAFINCIGNDETAIQAIESLSPTPSPVSEGSIFNVAGQRMSKLQKGVNIVNGKKVLVK